MLQLQPTWLFANAQQDAGEYFSNLCQADLGTLQPVPWLETRTDAIIAQGLSPLHLPVPPGTPLDSTAQADRREGTSVSIGASQGRSLRQSTPSVSISLTTLLLAWHITADTVSFLHYHPPVLTVSLPRFLRAAKLSWKLSTLDGDYLLPSGRPGSPVEMHPCHIQGGVHHLGPTPHAGHYRSFCRYRGSIWVGDDGHAGSLATQSDVLSILSNSYLLFLRQR